MAMCDSDSRAVAKRVVQRFVHALESDEVKDSEDLSDAINAALVHAGVRQAARLDRGALTSLLPALRRNKLTIVNWAGEYEPLVIRAKDTKAQALCDQLKTDKAQQDSIMGRLLEYGCSFTQGRNIVTCWMFNFCVYVRRIDARTGIPGPIDSNWLAGFKCCAKHTQAYMNSMVEKYKAVWVSPANYLLANTVLKTRSGQTFVIDRFAIETRAPRPCELHSWSSVSGRNQAHFRQCKHSQDERSAGCVGSKGLRGIDDAYLFLTSTSSTPSWLPRRWCMRRSRSKLPEGWYISP
jgi:hypothetical protein